MIKRYGADEVVSYKQEESALVDEIVQKTGGNLFKAFDATAQALQTISKVYEKTNDGEKRFTSTNDWSVSFMARLV
jgi:hypothetical protein